MAHFAKIENDVVTKVIVIPNTEEQFGHVYIQTELKLEGEWIQTSYNDNLRGNYAGIGYSYDRENDKFIAPKPYPSWTINKNWKWEAPIPYTGSNSHIEWNEEEQKWIEL